MIIPKQCLDIISNTVKKYSLFLPGDSFLIGFSGGKDSLFSILALRELGYQFEIATVDLGYEKDWDLKLKSIAKVFDINIKILTAEDNKFLEFVNKKRSEEFKSRYSFLKDKSNYISNYHTPCTQCYNVKIILLEYYANIIGSKKIILGHHKTDAIVSFLKSAFYYIDRWVGNNTVFNYDRFKNFITNVTPVFLDNHNSFSNSKLFKDLEILTANGHISCDESPKQDINSSPYQAKILRPIFFIDENVILNFINENKIITDDSDCGHTIAKNNITPREMIHFNIIHETFKNGTYDQISKALFPLIEKNISPVGKLIVNIRNKRDVILGEQYKHNLDYLKL